MPALPPTAGAAYANVQAQQVSEEALADVLNKGIVSVARVESPAGPLDCLVHAESKKDVEHLPGADLVVGSGRWTSPGPRCASTSEGSSSSVSVSPGSPSLSRGVRCRRRRHVPGAGGRSGDPDPVDPPVTPRGPPVDWEGVYEDVRPATEAYVAAVRERVLARNATAWTGVVDELGMTLSVTPDHVRADFGGGVEVHLDPIASPTWSARRTSACASGPTPSPRAPT